MAPGNFNAARDSFIANTVENKINSLSAGFFAKRFDKVFAAVIDGAVDSKLGDKIKVVWTAGSIDKRPAGLRQLYREMTDSTRTAMDKHGFPKPHPATRDKGIIGSASGQRHCRGLLICQIRWLSRHYG